MDQNDVHTPQNWADLLEWRKDFPLIVSRWMEIIRRLILHTKIQGKDELGNLIVGFMTSSLMDIDDLMTLSHRDSHHGAQYCLRALFERTVTLKYLSQNPQLLQDFNTYDAVDCEQILTGIHNETGMTVGGAALENLSIQAKAAREKNKQEKCRVCHNKRPTSWTRLDTREMAKRVGLDHLYLFGFTIPSKLMHPTLWGTRERLSSSSPLYNTLHCMHHLMIETLMIHRRHFMGKQYVTPVIGNAILDFLSVWVFSEVSFDGALTSGEVRDGKPIYYGFR